jgi:hypothetical protein
MSYPVRKTVALPASMWADVAAYQASERITTEVEALRRLVQAAVRAERGKAAER